MVGSKHRCRWRRAMCSVWRSKNCVPNGGSINTFWHDSHCSHSYDRMRFHGLGGLIMPSQLVPSGRHTCSRPSWILTGSFRPNTSDVGSSAKLVPEAHTRLWGRSQAFRSRRAWKNAVGWKEENVIATPPRVANFRLGKRQKWVQTSDMSHFIQ